MGTNYLADPKIQTQIPLKGASSENDFLAVQLWRILSRFALEMRKRKGFFDAVNKLIQTNNQEML